LLDLADRYIATGRSIIADPHHFDANPDPTCLFDADPDPIFQFDADPDPVFHFDADPYPCFQIKAQNIEKIF
jgi:hypothetical protein